ncbi:hypothetical protein N657DRAFT_582867 [Parathielavia appendiculata]|uniref:DUF7730 domain-containing protein n=1 Tax=Parathielavia appendiculata TaxID=2587402 RepID=A0AAN6YYJ8_9PEZI|nr:hypothetical protein N657DRAFT_582867 [Parathielavia appendiculata]
MQLNKERQRKIRNMLHRSFPREDTPQFEQWERNQQMSTLLRLPPELRNRIYELVLDVGQIHVCFKKWKHRIQTRNGQRYYETTEGGFCCQILDRDQNPWKAISTTNAPSSAASPRRGMTLLSPVCRQLYHETALLPFRLNAWSFESAQVMDRYVMKEKRLPRPHRRAIRLLYSPVVLPAPVENYFGGLQMIVLDSGLTMVRRVVEPGSDIGRHRASLGWEVHSGTWKRTRAEGRRLVVDMDRLCPPEDEIW